MAVAEHSAVHLRDCATRAMGATKTTDLPGPLLGAAQSGECLAGAAHHDEIAALRRSVRDQRGSASGRWYRIRRHVAISEAVRDLRDAARRHCGLTLGLFRASDIGMSEGVGFVNTALLAEEHDQGLMCPQSGRSPAGWARLAKARL
ncbi:MAG: hypothetical protein QOE58_2181 [Actinomycetota bacterium]|jgi:hypothetical protein|nr:hypothetical protein [Actinomycetota bacterium]